MKRSILLLLVFIMIYNFSFAQSLNWAELESKNPLFNTLNHNEAANQTILHLANSSYQPSIVFNQQWSESQGTWLEISKWEYPSYDDSGRATEYISYSYSEGTFTPAAKEIYEFNDGVQITTTQRYEEGNWVNYNRLTYSNFYGEEYDYTTQYDLLIENWDSTQWIPSTNTVVKYDNNGYPEKSLTERYVDGNWEPSFINTYTFNTAGQLIEQIDQYYNNEGQFVNSGKYEYTYDQNGYVDVNENYYWGENDWLPSNRSDYDYDTDGNILLVINYGWADGNWQESSRDEYHYQDGIFTGYDRDIINGGEWVEYRRLVNTIDANGNITEYLYQNYTNGNWVNASRLIYTYIEVTDIEEDSKLVPNDYSLSQNYPNPFNPSTIIKFSIPKSGNTSLKIYDLLGREVAELVNETLSAGSYSVTFDASQTSNSLSSGVYFYRLQTDNFAQAKKFILIK